MFDAVIVEGDLEVAVVPVLLAACGLTVDPQAVINKRGIQNFWRDVPRWNRGARHKRFFALADLEQAACAPGEILTRLGAPLHPNFVLRLAVRMTEAWLLADRSAMATFLRVPQAAIPDEPDRLPNPKQTLVQAAHHSKLRRIQVGISPEPGTGRPVGPDYLPLLSEFALQHWSPERAGANSPSLARALVRLKQHANAGRG